MHNYTRFAYPIARSLLALIFLLSAISKISDFSATQAYMASMSVPGFLLIPTILLELFGAIAIIVGYQTKWAAFGLAIFSVLTAAIFHADFANQMQMILFLKNIGLAGGLILLGLQGPGAFAIDAKSETSLEHHNNRNAHSAI